MVLGYFTDSTPLTPLRDPFNVLVDEINDNAALITSQRQVYTFRWADTTARNAQTGMRAGDTGFQVSTTLGVGIVFYYTGSTWIPWDCPFTSYTPTLTNFTIGTGGVAANTAEFKYSSGKVHVKGRAFIGTSGASVGSGVSLTLPVNAAAVPFTNILYPGFVTLFDAAPATSLGFVRSNGTSVSSVSILYQSPTTGNPANITSALPWTWAAGDAIYYDFEYTPA